MSETTTEGLRAAIAAAAAIAREAGRADLAARINEAMARAQRDDLMVAVVGEFKRGKSSLVNGLLGESVCPVSPVESTAVPTLLRYGELPLVRLTVADDAGQRVVEAPPAELAGMVLEDRAAPGAPQRLVAIVDLPNRFLETGYQVIDCPGVGGLGPGFADAALNLAGLADVAVVVADAGAPLDPATLDFLRRLCDVCPAALLALTRADMYRRGGALAEVRSQVGAAGLAAEVLALSTTLRFQALAAADAGLNEESGYPRLLALLQAVAERRDEVARHAAARAARAALTAISQTLAADQLLLSAPATGWDEALAEARGALDAARRDAGKWATLLNEGSGDAAARAEADSRKALRRILEEFEAQVESGALEGQALQARVQERVQAEVGAVFRELDRALAALERDLRALFEDTPDEAAPADRALTPEVPVSWPAAAAPKESSSILKEAAGSLYTSLKGAQGGIIMVGVFSGIAGLGLGTLAIAGVGAAFGGKQMLEERQRRLQAQRQQARNALRQFLDEAQAEVVRVIRELVREDLRRQRDAIAELAAAFVTAKAERERALALERDRTAAQRAARLDEVVRLRLRLAEVSKRLDAEAGA